MSWSHGICTRQEAQAQTVPGTAQGAGVLRLLSAASPFLSQVQPRDRVTLKTLAVFQVLYTP